MGHAMQEDHLRERALALFQQAYQEQMAGRFAHAADLYRASIAVHPTAEAHTFLGWTYSYDDKYPEAIEECHKAIAVDPEFGNPYNDIGSYLIHMGKAEDAISWLEKAKSATRYEPRHFPYLNLARAYMSLGRVDEAQREMAQARFIQENVVESDDEASPDDASPENPSPDDGPSLH